MSQVLKQLESGQSITIWGTIFMAIGMINYFVKVPGISQAAVMVQVWALVIGGFAWCLAYVIQNQRYIAIIRKHATSRKEDLAIAIIWMIFFWTSFVGGLIPPAYSRSFTAFYNWLCLDLNGQYMSSGIALVGFYTFSGAYRAFRLNKGFDYTVAVILCIFTMMAGCPLLGLISPSLPPVADWTNTVLSGYGYRGITITIGIGSILLGIRVLLGTDRRIYGVMERAAGGAGGGRGADGGGKS